MYQKEKGNCIQTITIGIIAGIIIGILYYFAFIPGIITATSIALIFAAIALILTIVIVAFGPKRIEQCIYKKAKCLAITAVGTILLALANLSITLVTGVVSIAIGIGIGGAFFAGTVIALLNFILCMLEPECKLRK